MFLGKQTRGMIAAEIIGGLAAIGGISYLAYQNMQAQQQAAQAQADAAKAEAAAAADEGAKQEAMGRAIVAQTQADQLKQQLAQVHTAATQAVAKVGAAAHPDVQQIASLPRPTGAGMFGGGATPLLIAGAALVAVLFMMPRKRARA